MDINTDMQAVIAAAIKGAGVETLDRTEGREVVYLPHGPAGEGEVKFVDLEMGRLAPLRKRGTVSVFDAASLNIIVADNKDAGAVSIYLDRDIDAPSIVAVLNGHGPSGPGWGDYRVKIEFRPTPQWTKWRAIDGKLFPQQAFAEFVEDNMADIVDPPGAHMLEIVTLLTATKATEFRSGVRLSDGQVQFTHSEDLQAKVGAGQIEVPQTFTLGLAPIYGGAVFSVPARFRFRLNEGKLTMGFKLQRLEDVMRGVVDDVVAKIERGTNVSVLEGKAPEPTKLLIG